MIIRNTSRYPTAEIEALIHFAAEGLNTAGVCINVRNGSGTIAGYAYSKVPRISNAPKSCKYLVTLRIGAPDKFPCDNVRTYRRWVRVKDGENYAVSDVRGNGDGKTRWLERQIISRRPYGGVLVEMFNWHEGFISLAAHEMRHVKQFREKLVCSETACETHANARLAAWRK